MVVINSVNHSRSAKIKDFISLTLQTFLIIRSLMYLYTLCMSGLENFQTGNRSTEHIYSSIKPLIIMSQHQIFDNFHKLKAIYVKIGTVVGTTAYRTYQRGKAGEKLFRLNNAKNLAMNAGMTYLLGMSSGPLQLLKNLRNVNRTNNFKVVMALASIGQILIDMSYTMGGNVYKIVSKYAQVILKTSAPPLPMNSRPVRVLRNRTKKPKPNYTT